MEELKKANEDKLAELHTKQEDCESALKSHRRELSVSDEKKKSASFCKNKIQLTY